MYIPFALSCKNAFSYKNALRITFDLFVVGNLLYEYRNYETAEICVSLYGTAQMNMLELFTPYLFQDSYRRRTDQEHPSAKERSSMLKTFKTVGTYVSFLHPVSVIG